MGGRRRSEELGASNSVLVPWSRGGEGGGGAGRRLGFRNSLTPEGVGNKYVYYLSQYVALQVFI
jgi:hypothetical protein